MNPGIRANLLIDVLKVFENKDHREVSIIFDTFIVDYDSSWNYDGDWEKDVLASSSDEALFGIAQFVGIEVSARAISTAFPDVWDSSGLRIFFSHSSKHKIWVAGLAKKMRSYGVHVFVAHEDIKPSREWIVQIQRALNTCDILLAHITDDFQKSDWCDQEAGFVLGRQMPVVPIYEGRIHGLVGLHQGIKCNSEDDSELTSSMVMDFLLNEDRTKARTIDSLVKSFVVANSYAKSKKLIEFLEKPESGFLKGHAEILRNAVKSNSQVSDSFGVSKRVDILIDRHELEFEISKADHDDFPF